MTGLLWLFTKDVLIAIGLYVWQLFGKYVEKLDAVLMTLLCFAYTAFVFVSGEWYLYGMYWQFLPLILFSVTTIIMLIRIKNLPFVLGGNPRRRFGQILICIITIVFIALATWGIFGRKQIEVAKNISFPLKNGVYAVVSGGDSPIINNEHAFPPIPQKYAVKIVKLGDFQTHAKSLYPASLDDFHIFGEKIYSPINGVVTAVVDSFPDQIGKFSEMTETIAYGNYLDIRFDNTTLRFAKLQQSNTKVVVGDTVSVGQQIASVGSSGEADFAHLFLELTTDATDKRVKVYWKRSGIPFQLNGIFPFKNMIYKVSK